MKIQNLGLVSVFVMLLCGCSLAPWQTSDNQEQDQPRVIVKRHASNSLHGHVEKLARQLFGTAQTFDSNQSIAVGTILPAMAQSGEPLPAEVALGLQIQESLMTFATQAGLNVVEFKTMPSIQIKQNSDVMLSRDIKLLADEISSDYFLTGTYTQQENNTIVNIRLIQLPKNTLVAAATDYIPNDVMWSDGKVILKNNQIYRNGY